MRKQILSLFFCAVLVMAFSGVKAQVSNYLFSQYNAPYSPINLGNPHYILGDETNDDNEYGPIDLGFTFYFNGNYYTQTYVNSNGFLFFIAPAVFNASNYDPLASGIVSQVIAPCGDDMAAQIGASLNAATTGTPGNMIFTVEWNNYSHYNETGSRTFQVKLFESGKIEFSYGVFSNATGWLVQVGLGGLTNADFINRSTFSDWDNTTAGVGNSDGCAVTTAVFPSSLLNFRWEPADLQITSILSPVVPSCLGSAETLKIRIKSNTITDLDFSQHPFTVSGDNGITNPFTFPNILLNSGILPGMASMDTTILPANFDMSSPGDYRVTVFLSSASDHLNSNDTIQYTFNSIPIGGIAIAGSDTICQGLSSVLHLSGSNGLIQWQGFNGVSWSNEAGPGSTSPDFAVAPFATKMYRAFVCGVTVSNQDTVNVLSAATPVTTGATRCGPGAIHLSAAGTSPLSWNQAQSPFNLVNTGMTFDPVITSTTSFNVSTSFAGPANTSLKVTEVQPLNASFNAFLEIQNLSGSAINTDGWTIAVGDDYTNINYVNTSLFYLPAGVGPLEVIGITDDASAPVHWNELIYWAPGSFPGYDKGWIMIQDNAGAVKDFMVWGWTAADLATFNTVVNGYPISMGSLIWSGDGIDASTTTFDVGLQRVGSSDNNTSADFLPVFADIGIQNSGLTPFQGTCSSTLTPVTATVTFSDTITATLSDTYLCIGASSTINVTSLNPGYAYSWSPTVGLNSSTSASTIASPVSSVTYTITAADAGTGCGSLTTAAISVNPFPPPSLTITANPPSICMGDSTQFNISNNFSNPATIGHGAIQNSATSFPCIYGASFAGARHQMLIRASELAAAGFQPGPVNSIAFYVENLNGAGFISNMTFKIGNTMVSSLASFQTGLQTVYTNGSYIPSVGWNTHHLSTPFMWDGTSNVLIETCFDSPVFYLNGNPSMMQTATPFISTLSNYTNTLSPCVNTALSGMSAQRPNIRLGRDFDLHYSWTPNTNILNPAIQNPYASPATSTTFSVSILDNLTSCAIQQTVPVAVGSLLPGAAGTISGTANVCQGSAGIAYSVPLISNAISYLWFLPPGATISSGAGTNSVLVDFGATTVSGNITVQGVNNCGAVLTGAMSPSFPVTMNSLPFTAGTISGSANVCSGEDSVAYFVGALANTDYYLWTIPSGAGIISGDSTNSVTIHFANNASSGNIAVNGVNTCGNGVSSPNFNVSVSPPLVFNITSSTGSFIICPGDTVTLGLIPACSNCQFFWNPHSVINDTTISTPLVYPVNNTTVTVNTKDSIGCSGSGFRFLSLGAASIAPVITQHNDTLFSTPGSSYQWYYNQDPVLGGTNQYLVILGNGDYMVRTAIGSNICPGESGLYTILNSHVAEFGISEAITLSPNPFSLSTELTCYLPDAAYIKVEIFNLLGQKLFAFSEKNETKEKHHWMIDRTMLDASGSIYFIKISTDKKSYSLKLSELK